MSPRLLHRTCLIAFLVGLALVILSPIALYALGTATAESPDAESVQAAIKTWWSRLFWLAPLGGGLLFSGGIGLLFLWVSKLANEPVSRKR